MLENKNQDPSKCLFWLALGSNIVDPRSGNGRFIGQSVIFAINRRKYSLPNFELLDARIASSLNKIIQNSYLKKKVSVRNRRLRKKIVFIEEGRSRT